MQVPWWLTMSPYDRCRGAGPTSGQGIIGIGAMDDNFHESYGRGEPKPPSERSTGILFAVVALIVAAISRNNLVTPWIALALAAVFATLSTFAPNLLKPLNMIWFRFGLLLHRIVAPIVMFAMFALVFVPSGLIMRIWSDPLRSRRATEDSSYWIERQTGGTKAGSMRDQF